MASDGTGKFYIIRFLQRPYPKVSKYACVPNSWFARKSPDGISYIGYPKEDPAKTKKRAENNENPQGDWKLFEVKVKYESDFYEDVDIWSAYDKTIQWEDEGDSNVSGEDDSTDASDYEIEMMHHFPASGNGSSNMQTSDESFQGRLTNFCEKQTNAMMRRRLHIPIAGSSKRESLPIRNNPLLRAQETVRKSINNAMKTTAAVTSSSYQSHQSSKSPHEQHISVPTYNGYSKQVVPETPIKRNGNNHSTQKLTPETQNLTNLLKQAHEDMSVYLNKHTSHQTLRALEIPNRNTEVNCIGQRSHPPNVTKNTPFAVPRSTNSSNLPHPLSKRPQKRKCPPAYTEHLPQTADTGKVVISSSTGLRFDESPRQSIENNLAPTVQNLSNPANQPGEVFKQSGEKEPLPAYNILVQQNSQVNKIIITNANEMDSNHPMISQSMSKNVLNGEQNFSNITNQLCQMSEQQLPVAPRDHFQQTFPDSAIVRTATGEKPLNLLSVSQNNTKSTQTAVQHFPGIENHFGQVLKASNQFQTPASLQNNVRQYTHPHRCLAGESTAANGLNQRPGLQDTPSAVPNSLTNQPLSKNSHKNQLPPVLQGYIFQDPHTKLVFLSKATGVNGKNETTPVQSTTENVPSALQTVPTSTQQSNQPFDHSNKHPQRCPAGESTAANGLNQRPDFHDTRQNTSSAVPNSPTKQPFPISENSHQNQLPPALKGYLLQDPHTKLVFLSKATGVNGKNETTPVQSTTENVPSAVQTVPTSTQQSNQPFSYKHPQRCIAGESTAANGLNQRPGLRNTRQNTPFATPNPSTNQTLPISENLHKNQLQPVLQGYLLQDPHTKLLFLRKATGVNGKDQTTPVQSTTENVPLAQQSVPTSTQQSKQSFDHLYKKQFAVDCRNVELPSLRIQQMFQRGPVTMDDTNQKVNPQNIIQNIPIATQNSSNSAAHSSCSCCSHRRQLPSVTPNDSYQEPGVQDALNSGSTEGNRYRQSVNPETGTENTFSGKLNPTNLATYAQTCTQQDQNSIRQSRNSQSRTELKPTAVSSSDLTYQSLEPSTAEGHSPTNVDSSDKVTIIEKVSKLISVNCTGESKKDGSTANQNLSNVINNLEGAKAEADQVLTKDFYLLCSQMNTNLSGMLEAYKNIQSKIIEHDKTFKKIIVKVTNKRKLRINRMLSSRSKKVEKSRNKLKRRLVMKSDDNHNHGDFEECEQPSQKKHSPSSFSLPPECNPNGV